MNLLRCWPNCAINWSSYILRRPQNFAKSSPYFWLQCSTHSQNSKVRGEFAKFCDLLRINELYINISITSKTLFWTIFVKTRPFVLVGKCFWWHMFCKNHNKSEKWFYRMKFGLLLLAIKKVKKFEVCGHIHPKSSFGRFCIQSEDDSYAQMLGC